MLSEWRPVEGGWKIGIAKNFFDQKGPHRLNLDTGDAVVIRSECDNWYYGFKRDSPVYVGIFPKSYITIVEGLRIVENDEEVFKVKRSNIVEEITTVLKEWRSYFLKFYLNDRENFIKIKEKMLSLIKLRQQMLSGNLPIDEMRELQLKVVAEIDTGNHMLNLDMVVRDEAGELIDFENISTTQLFELHCKAAQAIRISNRQPTGLRSHKAANVVSHNLLVTLERLGGSFPDDMELLFTVFATFPDKEQPITENFLVKIGASSSRCSSLGHEDIKMLFTDLSNEDLFSCRIYLVAYLVRLGPLEIKTPVSGRNIPLIHRNSIVSLTNMSMTDQMRRPYGVAYLDLTPLMKKPEEFPNTKEMNFVQCEKECLYTFLRRLLRESKDLPVTDKHIEVSVEVLHGDINKIKEDLKHVFRDKFFARKMGFPEVILPDDADDRNDLYLTLVFGKLGKSCKFSEDNIEVHVSVCNERGETIESVISKGGGASLASEYRSIIYMHDKEPKWFETFRIHLPFDQFEKCHVKFLFRHRSMSEKSDRGNRPFALSYLKLMNADETALHEDCHNLAVYKIDKKIDEASKFNYFSLPSHIEDVQASEKTSIAGYSYATKDFFAVQSNLCSIKLTQDQKLQSLLNWSSNPSHLDQSLKNLLDVAEAEVVKFLRDILDVLFLVLCNEETTHSDETENLIFDCVIKLIETVSNPKYKLFESVLDVYINVQFSAALAYKKLIYLFYRRIVTALNTNFAPTGEDPLYRVIKHMTYLMRFIIQSRILYVSMNGERDQASFSDSIEGLLCSFNQLIASEKDILKAKGAILKYLHIVVSDLIKVCEPIKLCRLVVAIVNNIPPGKLSQSKMTCIRDLVESQLFRLPQCRAELLPVSCAQIVGYLESNEEMQECINILNSMLKNLSRSDIGSVECDIQEIMSSLLRTIIQSVIVMNEENPLRGNLVAIMLGIFHHMRSEHYRSYVANLPTQVDKQDFLTEILMVFKTLVSNPVFPRDWMDMIMHQNKVILESLRQFSAIIVDYFSGRELFEKAVWSKFFYCATEFLVQPALQIDKFTPTKRSLTIKRYCDIRQLTAAEVRNMWFNLSSYKIQFIPELVQPFLRMSMLPDEGIRRATIPIFFDMMKSEFFSSRYHSESLSDARRNPSHCKASFIDFETEMVKKLDCLIRNGEGDEQYRRLFYDIMVTSCHQHTNLKEEGVVFVNKVSVLMQKLLEYRNVEHDQSKENLLACTFHLHEFYEERKHIDMYVQYLERLFKLQKQNDNYIEAAFALKKFTDLLQWKETKLDDNMRLNVLHLSPNCTHREVKQMLYMEIINLFDRGKMWESAIKICKELALQYENETFDYCELSKIHDRMSKFYGKILKEPRLEMAYYRVAFYGLGFPEFLCNKQFIYRAMECEKLESFTTRLQIQHPQAEIMKELREPGEETKKSRVQLIQVVAVKPQPNDFVKTLQEKFASAAITNFHKYNNVKVFELRRPMMLEGFARDDIAGLAIERTLMETTHPLPGILRSAPISTVMNVRLRPIENACETMENTNRDLLDLIVEYSGDPKLPLHPLTMKIGGIVDAAVQGGFKKYEEAFLVSEYLEQHPADFQWTQKLKECIAEQMPLLERLLDIHRDRVKEEAKKLHLNIEEKFFQMRSDVEAKYGKRTSDAFLDNIVILRKPLGNNIAGNGTNRQSDTSVGSGDSDKTKTSNIFSSLMSFNPTNTQKRKEKKRQRSTDNRATATWHLSQDPLNSPISAPTTPVTNGSASRIELCEKLTTKRPLRSERNSRPSSSFSATLVEGSQDSLDMITMDDSLAPPPLPAKASSELHLGPFPSRSSGGSIVSFTNSGDSGTYTTVTLRNTPVTSPDGSYSSGGSYGKKTAPPTPPPKPSRGSKANTPTKDCSSGKTAL